MLRLMQIDFDQVHSFINRSKLFKECNEKIADLIKLKPFLAFVDGGVVDVIYKDGKRYTPESMGLENKNGCKLRAFISGTEMPLFNSCHIGVYETRSKAREVARKNTFMYGIQYKVQDLKALGINNPIRWAVVPTHIPNYELFPTDAKHIKLVGDVNTKPNKHAVDSESKLYTLKAVRDFTVKIDGKPVRISKGQNGGIICANTKVDSKSWVFAGGVVIKSKLFGSVVRGESVVRDSYMSDSSVSCSDIRECHLINSDVKYTKGTHANFNACETFGVDSYRSEITFANVHSGENDFSFRMKVEDTKIVGKFGDNNIYVTGGDYRSCHVRIDLNARSKPMSHYTYHRAVLIDEADHIHINSVEKFVNGVKCGLFTDFVAYRSSLMYMGEYNSEAETNVTMSAVGDVRSVNKSVRVRLSPSNISPVLNTYIESRFS